MDEQQEEIITHEGKQYKKVDSESWDCKTCCFLAPFDGFGSECNRPMTSDFTGCGNQKFIYVEVKS